MSKEELEKAGDAYLDTLGYRESWSELDVSDAFVAGAQWQSSQPPASLGATGEGAASEYADKHMNEDVASQHPVLRTAIKARVVKHYLAGFQARAHLVELLKESGDWLRHGRDKTAAMDALIARIDAALKGEA